MGNNTTFQKHFFDRLSKDDRFMAYYFSRYLEFEKCELAALIKRLLTDEEGVYKLGGCIAPIPKESNFEERISAIAEFAGADARELGDILRKTFVMDRFSKRKPENTHLLAARDKFDEE